jgi:purine-binding chemotaxis protein CheW
MILGDDNRYMELKVGTNLFAIPLLSVKEVISKPELTVVPNMPSHFEGMINLRGQILGVYSARRKIGVKAADGGAQEVVVILDISGTKTGVVVDDVTRVLHTEPSMLREAPIKEDDPAFRYISGVIEFEKELVQIINMSALLEFGNQSKRQAA